MDSEGLRFAYPQLLFLILPVAAWLFWVLKSRPNALSYSATGFLAQLVPAGHRAKAVIFPVLRALVLLLLVLAAARPQAYTASQEILSPGVDIILCMDTSGSMLAMDFTLDNKPVTRLAAVKKVAKDFIRKRPHDRIGIVVFGSYAFTQVPPTSDQGLLLSLTDDMAVNMAGQATAIGDALAIAGKRLKDLPGASKVVILLTDGEENAGEIDAPTAARALAALGIRIHAVGVGTTGSAPFLQRTLFGDQFVYRQVVMDEDALKRIAQIGGGRYFVATETAELEAIYDELDQLEKTEVKVKKFFHFQELFPWFLAAALLLVAVEMFAWRWRPLP
ncbi:MAG: VWA domain-containing protein [Desulfatibacillaceae bacterium]|nr:VWA domain-containing protein [Desulfatibacillaceae bacterium]